MSFLTALMSLVMIMTVETYLNCISKLIQIMNFAALTVMSLQ
jgi:hypothetical protein